MTSRAKWIAGSAVVAAVLLCIAVHESRGLPLSGLSDHPSDAQAREREASRGASFGSLSPHAAESLTQALERLGLLEAVRPVMDLCAMVWELPFEGVETLNVGGRSRLVIRGGHGSSLSFDSDTRRLIGCFAGGFWRERPFSVDGTLIPHAEAAEKAQDFVHALGFTDDLPEMPCAIHGDGNNKPPWGVEYEFTQARVYGAFRTGSRIFVEVSGHTGLVTAFDDFPLQIPESTEVLLSPEEAMSIARDVCVAHGLDAEVDSDWPPELWIFPSRLPQNCWTTDDPELYSDRDWTRSRACYRVGLHDQAICRHQRGSRSRQLMAGYVVFVDCGTGEVVDGFRF